MRIELSCSAQWREKSSAPRPGAAPTSSAMSLALGIRSALGHSSPFPAARATFCVAPKRAFLWDREQAAYVTAWHRPEVFPQFNKKHIRVEGANFCWGLPSR